MKLFIFICLFTAFVVTDDNTVKKLRSAEQLKDQEEKESSLSLNNSESTPVQRRKLGSESGEEDGDEEEDDIITKLEKRVAKLNDKVDHLLFHNHHDLVGVTAHIGLAGVQFLPGTKGKDSIDQRLKHVDYLNAYGKGFNPMMHTVMTKPISHKHDEGELKADIPSNSNEDSGEDDEERKKKHVIR